MRISVVKTFANFPKTAKFMKVSPVKDFCFTVRGATPNNHSRKMQSAYRQNPCAALL